MGIGWEAGLHVIMYVSFQQMGRRGAVCSLGLRACIAGGKGFRG